MMMTMSTMTKNKNNGNNPAQNGGLASKKKKPVYLLKDSYIRRVINQGNLIASMNNHLAYGFCVHTYSPYLL